MEEQEDQYEELEKGTELTIDRAAARAYGELRRELGEALYDLVIIEDDFGYEFGAKRIRVGAFDIVVVDWMHPNHGYFSEGMLWVRTLHEHQWKPFADENWRPQYTRLGEFLQEFPKFRSLFVDIPEDAQA